MSSTKIQIVGSIIKTDGTLTKSGMAADAKAVGDAIIDIEERLANLSYEAIEITSFTNNVGTVELGNTVDSVTFEWVMNKAPTTLMLDDNLIDIGLNRYTYSNLDLYSTSVATNTYTLKAIDERGYEASKSTHINFYNGIYYGVVDNGTAVNSSTILGLTKKLQNSRSTTFTANAGNDQYVMYSQPSRLGAPSFNVGGFDGGFHLEKTIKFTNAYGYAENYDIYFSDNLALGSITVKVS